MRLKIIISAAILLFTTAVFSNESNQIQYIKDEYKKVTDKTQNKNDPLIATSESQGPLWNIMGIPKSKTVFYWESYIIDTTKPDSDTNNAMRLRKTESYHSGISSADQFITYDEFLFDANGKVLFCFIKKGTGNLARTNKCKWEKEERYYFHNEKLIRFVKEGTINDNPDKKAVKNGGLIVERGKMIKTIAENINTNWSDQIDNN